jgi:hypothetical protein
LGKEVRDFGSYSINCPQHVGIGFVGSVIEVPGHGTSQPTAHLVHPRQLRPYTLAERARRIDCINLVQVFLQKPVEENDEVVPGPWCWQCGSMVL